MIVIVYDNTGATYNATKIINSDYSFNLEKYEGYSSVGFCPFLCRLLLERIDSVRCKVYLPITYAISNFGLEFAAVISLLVWFGLENHKDIMNGIRSLPAVLCRTYTSMMSPCISSAKGPYKAVSLWWYVGTAALAMFLLIFGCEYWEVQLPWYGAIIALTVSSLLFAPVSSKMVVKPHL